MIKKLLITLGLVLGLVTTSLAADQTFSWTPNSESDLAGYKIYCGTESGTYGPAIDASLPMIVDNTVLYTISGLTAGGTYFCVGTAYNTDGFESAYSNEVNFIAQDMIYPAAPTNFLNVISRTNPDGTIDILDSNGVVLLTLP